jgi:hypothetical protein
MLIHGTSHQLNRSVQACTCISKPTAARPYRIHVKSGIARICTPKPTATRRIHAKVPAPRSAFESNMDLALVADLSAITSSDAGSRELV